MQPNPFILQMEMLNLQERTSVLPRDMQSFGAEDRMEPLSPESQMPREIVTFMQVDRWYTQGKKSHLYSLGI